MMIGEAEGGGRYFVNFRIRRQGVVDSYCCRHSFALGQDWSCKQEDLDCKKEDWDYR